MNARTYCGYALISVISSQRTQSELERSSIIEVLDKVRNVKMIDCAATAAEVNVLAFLTYFRNLVYTLEIADEHWKHEMNRLFYLALTEALQEEISTRLPPADKRLDFNEAYGALYKQSNRTSPHLNCSAIRSNWRKWREDPESI